MSDNRSKAQLAKIGLARTIRALKPTIVPQLKGGCGRAKSRRYYCKICYKKAKRILTAVKEPFSVEKRETLNITGGINYASEKDLPAARISRKEQERSGII